MSCLPQTRSTGFDKWRKGKRRKMKREFLKGFTMLALVVTLTLTLAVISANGQSNANRVVTNVPFEFSVGYKALPAGTYSVQSIASCHGVLIQSADVNNSALGVTGETQP